MAKLNWRNADLPDHLGTGWRRGPHKNETKYSQPDSPSSKSVYGYGRWRVRADLAQQRTIAFWAGNLHLIDGLPRADRKPLRRKIKLWLKKRLRKDSDANRT